MLHEPVDRRGVTSSSTFFSPSCPSSSSRNFRATLRITSIGSEPKETRSRRGGCGNFGREHAARAPFLPSLLLENESSKPPENPIDPVAISRLPALLDMIRMTLRKSLLRPLLSVSVA